MGEPDDPQANRRRAIAAMLAVGLLVVAGYWMSRGLQRSTKVEDCLMAGRRNCMPLDPVTGEQRAPK